MPPAVIAIGALVAQAAVTIFVSSTVVAAILTLAIGIAATLLLRRPTGRTNSGQELRLKLDPTMPRQLVLGRSATGGSAVWAFTYGEKGKFLVRVIALSDLPINGVVKIMEGKKQLLFDGDVTTGYRECTNAHKTDGGNERVLVRVYKGSPAATADANLISWSGGAWTSAHKGTNMSYAVVRCEFDKDGNAFPTGEPQLVFVLDGVKCYDDRKDSTKPGGSGSHRIDNPATWEFTRNTAILCAQSLRGFFSNGVLIFGAEAEERDLSTDMLFSAYNTCDQNVTYSGGSQKRYESGMMVNSIDPLVNYLQEFQAAFDGRIIDRGGAITLLPGATRTPVFNLTDDDIIEFMEKSWQPKATLSELYNHVAGVFVDEESIFSEKGYPPLRNTSWESDDGGERLTLNVSFTAVNDWARVQRITKRIHQQSRFQGTVAFYLPLWAIEMEQGDWFTVTSERWGLTSKYFEAITVDLVDTMHVVVIGRETSATIDGWDHSVDEKPRDDSIWNEPEYGFPVPILSPQALYQVNEAEHREEFGVAITVTGFADSPSNASTLRIQIAPTDNLTQLTDLPIAQALDQTITYFGLLPGRGYSVRGQVSDGTHFGPFSSWVGFTTAGTVLGVAVSVPAVIQFAANYQGVVNSGLLPYTYTPIVVKGTTNVGLSNDTSYSVVFVGCTGTVDNTNGSADKGDITINTVDAVSGEVRLTVTYQSMIMPTVITQIQRVDGTPPPSSGTLYGFVIYNPISSTSYSALTEVGTVTLGSGESLYGTGTVSYQITGAVLGTTKRMVAKWQYSPAGAGTWTDFGAAINGSYSEKGGKVGSGEDIEVEPNVPGSITLTQTKGSLSAGDYDVRAVAIIDPSTGGTLSIISGGLQVEAKV